MFFKGSHSPRGGSQSCDERLQQSTNVAVGVPLGHQEVEQRQDKEAMDEETNNDRHGVHP